MVGEEGGDAMAEPRRAVEVLHGVLAHWAESVTRILRHEDATSSWFFDEDLVHDARVGGRRIRANLRTFHTLVEPSWSTRLRGELAWFDGPLGRARDLQLLGKAIEVHAALVCRPHEVDRLAELVQAELEAAWASVVEMLADPRFQGVLESLDQLHHQLPVPRAATSLAGSDLRGLCARAAHDVVAAGRRAKRDPNLHHLHLLRIRAKALRYGAETAAVVDGLPAHRCATAAENLQGRLGAVQDAATAMAWLSATGTAHPSLQRPTARLVELQRDLIARGADGWQDDLKTIRRRWDAWGTAASSAH